MFPQTRSAALTCPHQTTLSVPIRNDGKARNDDKADKAAAEGRPSPLITKHQEPQHTFDRVQVDRDKETKNLKNKLNDAAVKLTLYAEVVVEHLLVTQPPRRPASQKQPTGVAGLPHSRAKLILSNSILPLHQPSRQNLKKKMRRTCHSQLRAAGTAETHVQP